MPHATPAVSKVIIQQGNGSERARAGDTVVMHYTGYLYDASKPGTGYRGRVFDTSHQRGEFITQIGVGRVIRGWDHGVCSLEGGMSLGEQATLRISSEYAYGPNGFPGLIPGNADLIFDVALLAINNKRAR